MTKMAVVKSGNKQYLVKEQDFITVDKVNGDKNTDVQLQTLAILDTDKENIELGLPALKRVTNAKIVEDGKGEKVRVAKFHAKVRYRKVKGFRPSLTKLQITKIEN